MRLLSEHNRIYVTEKMNDRRKYCGFSSGEIKNQGPHEHLAHDDIYIKIAERKTTRRL